MVSLDFRAQIQSPINTSLAFKAFINSLSLIWLTSGKIVTYTIKLWGTCRHIEPVSQMSLCLPVSTLSYFLKLNESVAQLSLCLCVLNVIFRETEVPSNYYTLTFSKVVTRATFMTCIFFFTKSSSN